VAAPAAVQRRFWRLCAARWAWSSSGRRSSLPQLDCLVWVFGHIHFVSRLSVSRMVPPWSDALRALLMALGSSQWTVLCSMA